MSVVLSATVDRRSISFAREVQALKEKTRALQRELPNQRLITGKREEGSKVHLVVMVAKAPAAHRVASSGNQVVAAPQFL